MKLYLITFELVGDDRQQRMVSAIKEYGIWARITNYTWCIKAENKTTAEIRSTLNEKCPLQSEDRLMVVNITNSAWASYYLPQEVADWLKKEE